MWSRPRDARDDRTAEIAIVEDDIGDSANVNSFTFLRNVSWPLLLHTTIQNRKRNLTIIISNRCCWLMIIYIWCLLVWTSQHKMKSAIPWTSLLSQQQLLYSESSLENWCPGYLLSLLFNQDDVVVLNVKEEQEDDRSPCGGDILLLLCTVLLDDVFKIDTSFVVAFFWLVGGFGGLSMLETRLCIACFPHPAVTSRLIWKW